MAASCLRTRRLSSVISHVPGRGAREGAASPGMVMMVNSLGGPVDTASQLAWQTGQPGGSATSPGTSETRSGSSGNSARCRASRSSPTPRRSTGSPEDYADCIAILAELGAIDDALRQRLVRMARFRNPLVHLYWRVVDAEVHRVIREDLGDFDEYLASLGRYLGADLR